MGAIKLRYLTFAAALTFLSVSLSAQVATPLYTFQVDGLACPFCAYGIEKQLNAIDGVAAVAIDIKTGTVRITLRAGATLDEMTAGKAVKAAGFTMRGFKREGQGG